MKSVNLNSLLSPLRAGDCRHCSAVASSATISEGRTLRTTGVSSDDSQIEIDPPLGIYASRVGVSFVPSRWLLQVLAGLDLYHNFVCLDSLRSWLLL